MKLALLYGLLVLMFVVAIYVITTQGAGEPAHDHNSHYHPPTEVHEHADFLMVLDGQTIDLSLDKYQSGLETGVKHSGIHLHDNQGNILHRHAEGVTIGDLLTSIGFELTSDCITTDTGETYCEDADKALLLYVNGLPQDPIAEYIVADEDQVLLYYGDQNLAELQSLLGSITDEACIYSGTCPERGTPPPEACGLTCEVAPEDL